MEDILYPDKVRLYIARGALVPRKGILVPGKVFLGIIEGVQVPVAGKFVPVGNYFRLTRVVSLLSRVYFELLGVDLILWRVSLRR